MRSLLCICMSLVVLASTGFAQTSDAAQNEVMVAHRIWTEYFSRDCSGATSPLEHVLADNFTFVAANGALISRAEFLKIFGCSVSELSSGDDVSVRVYGGGAVVTGRLKVETVEGYRPRREDLFRYANVYVREPKRWRLSYSQFTRAKGD